MKQEKINIYAYYRVSSAAQRKRNSIAEQKMMLKMFLQTEEGQKFNLIQEFEDDGKSGTTFENRTEFQRMREELKNRKKCRTFFVTSANRISRDFEDFLKLVIDFSSKGITIYTLEDSAWGPAIKVTYDPDAQTEDKFNNVYRVAGMAFEASALSKKLSMRGIVRAQEKLNNGEYNIGNVLYGYTWNKEKKCFEIVEERAEIVKRIFNMFVNERRSYNEITKILNEEEVPHILYGNVKKNHQWNDINIAKIISCETYATGERIFLKKESRERRKLYRARLYKKQNLYYNENGTLEGFNFPVEGKEVKINCFPTIIPLELYQQAMNRVIDRVTLNRKQRSDAKDGITARPLLQGLLYCGHCGEKMIVKENSKRIKKIDESGNEKMFSKIGTYCCKKRKTKESFKYDTGCGISVTLSIDNFVFECLKEELKKNDIWHAIEKELPILLKDQLQNGVDVGKIKEKIKQAEDKMKRIDNMYELGRKTEEEYKKDVIKFESEKEKLFLQLKSCNLAEEENNKILNYVKNDIDTVLEIQKVKRELILQFIEKVVFWRIPKAKNGMKYIEIYYKYFNNIRIKLDPSGNKIIDILDGDANGVGANITDCTKSDSPETNTPVVASKLTSVLILTSAFLSNPFSVMDNPFFFRMYSRVIRGIPPFLPPIIVLPFNISKENDSTFSLPKRKEPSF